MHTEETAERVGPVLATAVGRGRWLSGHLVFALGGAVALLALCGLVTGLLHGVRVDDLIAGLWWMSECRRRQNLPFSSHMKLIVPVPDAQQDRGERGRGG